MQSDLVVKAPSRRLARAAVVGPLVFTQILPRDHRREQVCLASPTRARASFATAR